MNLNSITKLTLIFFLCSASAPYFYANDKHQAQAVEQIRKEIASRIRQKNSSPIQAVLQGYKIRDAVSFSVSKNDSDLPGLAGFLPKNRLLKIRRGEWIALKKSRLELASSENGSYTLTLLDLDEDGRRDLIIEAYVGGTGLFTQVHVYRRRAGQFVAPPSEESTEYAEKELYSINGRGSDQAADWVRINGRVYLAYRNGEYGKDELFLTRAFANPTHGTKGLIVEYNYQHNLPRRQQKINERTSTLLEPNFHAALQKGLTRIQLQPVNLQETDFGKCPVPENLSADEREEYASSWFGAGHYTFDVVADFPVYDKNRCYMARLINFKSSYMTKNEYVPTALWLLRRPAGQEEAYNVKTTRMARRVEIAVIE